MRIGSAGVHASFGVGLAFYATSSTDAALATLPASQAGAGSCRSPKPRYSENR